MVRKLVVMAAALGLGLGVANTASAQSIVVGGQAGINIADVSVSTDFFTVSPDSRSGFWGGLFADFGVASWFHVRPELLFSSKGFKLSEVGGDARLRVNYIQIPILLAAVIPIANSPLRPVVFVGPAIAFESKCEVQGDLIGTTVAVDCDDDLVELDRKKSDFSVIFGGELGFMVGKVIPGVGVRYDLGLTNLDDSGIEGESLKNRTLTIYAQVGVPVK